jgi:hypothetical protein
MLSVTDIEATTALALIIRNAESFADALGDLLEGLVLCYIRQRFLFAAFRLQNGGGIFFPRRG